jgi:hypothetical protein
MVAAAVALESIAIALGFEVSGWAVAGLALVLIAAVAWCVYLFSLRSFLLIAGLPALAMVIARQQLIGPIQAAIGGTNPAVTWTMIGLGVAALAGLGWRLRKLSEEMPEYSRRPPATMWDASRAARRERQHWEAQVIAKSRLQGWFSDLLFRLVLPRVAKRNAWSRFLLRQLAGGYSSIVLAPIQLLFALAPLGVLLAQKSVGIPNDVAVPLLMVMTMPILFAMGILTAAWLERWPYVSRELLFPVSRADFIRDLIRSSACDVLGLALGHAAGIVVGLVLFAPKSLVVVLLACLAITAMQYVVLFGAMLWLASFRHDWIAILGILVAAILSGVLGLAALLAGDGLWIPWTLAVAAAVTVVAAVGLYRVAFRRWCEADVG